MPRRPEPGTFRLYPYAEPPLPAGRYTLTGSVAGLPGEVEPMPTTVDVVAPRFALTPDQVLGTFPPAGARGSFTSRLPQVVLRRRTLPWERSPDLEPGAETTPDPDEAPTPWLALVLVAEGEAQLLHDQPVDRCVSDGVTLAGERDVPTGTCLAVPQSVVDLVFPTREDLSVLTHVREVDLLDTELAMGDDDGWMAVVLANRLPQPGTRYLACLVNLEQQWDRLPDPADLEVEDDYDPRAFVMDLRLLALARSGPATTADLQAMGLPGDLRDGTGLARRPITRSLAADAVETSATSAAARVGRTVGPVARSATHGGVPTGKGWAATTEAISATTAASPATGSVGTAGPAAGTGAVAATVTGTRLALADGFAFPAALALEPTLKFPVLAYWSFSCEERGDFQYLAEHVTSRLLGHVPDPGVPDTPDGDPPADGVEPPAAVPEPPAGRPLPLVTDTGHVELAAVSRRGDSAPAWFRGPLVPSPVERAEVRPDGSDRPPLAHHADQLRRVTPDGREDLGYAAAFEIGRLLALSQPGVAAALTRWRQERFGAARVSGLAESASAELPEEVRTLVDRPDPHAADSSGHLRPDAAGRRTARALLEFLGSAEVAVAQPRPVVDPAVTDDVEELTRGGRDRVVLEGLGLAAALADVPLDDVAAVNAALVRAPALVAGERDPERDGVLLRRLLEGEAGRIAAAARTGEEPTTTHRVGREPR